MDIEDFIEDNEEKLKEMIITKYHLDYLSNDNIREFVETDSDLINWAENEGVEI